MAAGGGLVGLATAGGPRLWQNPYRRGVGTDAGSEWTGAPDCTGRADGGGCARCDELAVWRYPQAWDMLMFGLRLGANPRCVVTTTPKRMKLLRDLIQDS